MTDSPIEGLPDDLARVLRDQSIIVPQDAAVWSLLEQWRTAPSNTASAPTFPDGVHCSHGYPPGEYCPACGDIPPDTDEEEAG